MSANEPAETVQNPYQMATASTASNALANSDAQRSVAEVQAALVIARMNPRDPRRVMDLILQDCTRPGLAERAVYAYARGGSDITGPSIRLAEAIAQRWGNLQYGVRELEQRDGESVIQAYAWDVETNTRREVTFSVPHVRDTKRGRVHLEDARDIYELTANNGARRVRACILGVIPGDVVEAAQRQCELTMKAKADVTPERVAEMLRFFETFGVTKEMVEKRIQRRVDAMTPALLLQLGKIANSLKDGMSAAADWFETAPAIQQPKKKEPAETKPATDGTKPAQTDAATSGSVPSNESAKPEVPLHGEAAGQSLVDALDDPKPEAKPETKVEPVAYDPQATYRLTEVREPAGKDYVLLVTAEGFVAHAFRKQDKLAVANAKAAHAGGLLVRIAAVASTWQKVPWRAMRVEPVEEREPGSDG